ncbi:hypothetical protein D3C86_2018900 [compost metagenome]
MPVEAVKARELRAGFARHAQAIAVAGASVPLHELLRGGADEFAQEVQVGV